MKQTRIPIKYVAFDLWLNSTNNYLQSEDPDNVGHKQWERLGLTAAEAGEWDDNTTAWNAWYAKYTNKAMKTLAVVHQCRTMKSDITKGTRPIVNRIATDPAATDQDAVIFNFVLNRKSPT